VRKTNQINRTGEWENGTLPEDRCARGGKESKRSRERSGRRKVIQKEGATSRSEKERRETERCNKEAEGKEKKDGL